MLENLSGTGIDFFWSVTWQSRISTSQPCLLERGGKIGQPDWLGSDRGLIKIPDRRLDEKNFHSVIFTAESAGTAEQFSVL